MPLILVVYDQNLVWLVLVDAKLCKNLIFLYVLSWETDGISDMTQSIIDDDSCAYTETMTCSPKTEL